MPIPLLWAEHFPVMRSIIKSKKGRWILTAFSILFWIGVWQFAAWRINDELFLPSAKQTAVALWELVCQKDFWAACGNTLTNMLAGWLQGVLAGGLLAILTYRFQLLEILFSPLLTVVRATPVASFIMLLWAFFSKDNVPSVAVSLIVFPIVYANLHKGLTETDEKLWQVGKIHRFGPVRMAKYVFIPSAMPYFLSSLLTSLGLGWKAGVAAEVICTPNGTLGKYIYNYKGSLLTSEMFACTLCVVAICFLLEKGLSTAVRRLAGKRGYTL